MANPRGNVKNLQPPWKPGQSGNPTGTNRPKRLSALLRHIMAQPAADDSAKTIGMRFVEEVVLAALRTGNVALIREIWDRHDGKVPSPEPAPEDMSLKTDAELEAIAKGRSWR